jgi:hypothetical protein
VGINITMPKSLANAGFSAFLFGFEYSLSVIFGFLCKIGRLLAFF